MIKPETAQATKVIFLDIDGPLVSRRCWTAKNPKVKSTRHAEKFDPISVGLVNALCKNTGAKIVISSSWRTGDDQCKRTLIDIAGIEADYFHENYETPRFESKSAGEILLAKRRGDEISEWILHYGEPKAYVILDDDADMLGHQLPNFVQVTFEDGILYKHYEKCLERLGVTT